MLVGSVGVLFVMGSVIWGSCSLQTCTCVFLTPVLSDHQNNPLMTHKFMLNPI